MENANCICGHDPSEHNSQGICKKCSCKKFSGRNSVTSQPSGSSQLLFITQMVKLPEINLDEINQEISGLVGQVQSTMITTDSALLKASIQTEKEDSGLTKDQTLWDKFQKSFEKKDFESIPDLMDKILTTGHDQQFASFYKAYALDELGRYEEAITCCEDALDIDPKYVRALNCKGLILYDRLSKYPEALECYNKTLELEPKNNYSLFCKGVICNHLEKFEEALECYNAVIDIGKKDVVSAQVNKGLVLSDLGQYEEAITFCNKLLDGGKIDSHESLANINNNKGRALSLLGRGEEALKCYNDALDLNDNLAVAWNNKARSLEKFSKYV